MMFSGYKAGGPLSEGDGDIYVLRDADYEIIKNLQMMNYVLIIEPRQQGKTSLIRHLIHNQSLPNHIIIHIDISSCDVKTQEGWYKSLCVRIGSQLKSQHHLPLATEIPTNSLDWRIYLSCLANIAKENEKRIVIVLDEIGSANFPEASDFFTVLRDVYNSRHVENEFKEITFVLMGTFHPRNLISNDAISPFNIAQVINLPDFRLEQIKHLIQTNCNPADLDKLAEKIFFWTNGQPYLTQLMCSYITTNNLKWNETDKFVNYVLREDKNHIPSLVMRLQHAGTLFGYAKRVLGGEKIKYFPGINSIQEDLRLIGLLDGDKDGHCCLRNRIYQLALKTCEQNFFDVFICHNTIDKPEIKKILHRLKDANISPWLDEWELPPGLPWQRLLEAQVEQIKSAAVFVGENGIGPWQQLEIEAFLREFVKRGCPVIPVLLSSASNKPDLPVFLAVMNWVDFTQEDPDPLERLIWGITGKKPRHE